MLLQMRGKEKESAVQITNRIGIRTARPRLSKTIGTDTGQCHCHRNIRGWRRCPWAAPSLPACCGASEEGLSWAISREHRENWAVWRVSGKAWAECPCCVALERNYRPAQCTRSSSGAVPLLDSGVFLQEEQGIWLLQIPTAMTFVVFILYPTIFYSLWLNLFMFIALFLLFCFNFTVKPSSLFN